MLGYIREAVSCRSITQAIIGLNLKLSNQGYLVHGVQESTSTALKKPADNEHINGMVRQWNIDDDRAYGEVRQYLNANASASKYAVYFNSTTYEKPASSTDPNPNLFENDANATSFVF